MNGELERLWGCGSVAAVFGDSELRVAPWSTASRTRKAPLYEQHELTALLDGPPRLTRLDPRVLLATQTWVLATHVGYYLTGQWERSGTTSADRDRFHNRYPLVHVDVNGRHILLAGHHRSMAALIEGRPVLARMLRAESPAVAVLPHLLVGTASPSAHTVTNDPTEAAAAVAVGQTALVPDLASAEATMEKLGLAADLIEDRVAMATSGRCLRGL